MKKTLMAALLTATMLNGCVTAVQERPKETIGTAAGAGLGALVGSQFGKGSGQIVAIGLGALAGGFIGNQIGAALDDADRQAAERAAEKAMTDNRPVSWQNPESGHSGEIRPTRTYVDGEGRSCREYETAVFIDGKKESAVRRACQSPDGRWRDA